MSIAAVVYLLIMRTLVGGGFKVATAGREALFRFATNPPGLTVASWPPLRQSSVQ